MSAIEKYMKDVERLISQTPYKLSTRVVSENRGEAALSLQGMIVFTNNSELHFREYVISIPVLKKLAYSYHYQNKNKEMLFRFDNAEHHPEVNSYPHHKHEQNKVLSSKEMSLEKAIAEVIKNLLSHGTLN